MIKIHRTDLTMANWPVDPHWHSCIMRAHCRTLMLYKKQEYSALMDPLSGPHYRPTHYMGSVVMETHLVFLSFYILPVLDSITLSKYGCNQITLSLGVHETWLRLKCKIESMEDSMPETIPQGIDHGNDCVKLPRVSNEECMILVKEVSRTLENGSDRTTEV